MKSNDIRSSEQGFILVTSIILLAILMGLGAAAMFKTQVQIKVSASAADSSKAFAAAQAGLDYTYNYWSQDPYGQEEFKAIAKAAASSGTTDTNILNDKAPTSVDNVGATTTAAALDTWVRGSAAKRVYNLTSAGISLTSNSNWHVDNYAQVAVWTTRFKPDATGYPYATPKTTTVSCSDCTAVTYVLGRSGNAYKLIREYAFISEENVAAFGAMTNAPRYKNDADGCYVPPASPPAASTTTSVADGAPSGSAITGSHLIDATQAPGGTAIASNNGVDQNSGKVFYGDTGVSFQDLDPYVIFDPGKVSTSTPTYPEVAGGLMGSVTTSISSSRFDPYADPYMDYFASDSDQLFQLNAYREAANRISGFANETLRGTFPDGSTSYTVNSSGTTLGKYTTVTSANGTPVMGTLQWAQLKNNINNSEPMYGILRFMVPVESNGTMTLCGTTQKFKRGGQPEPDKFSNSLAGGTGKLIVYGGALFDFFYDGYTGIVPVNPPNGIYEPSKERLLTPLEAAQNGFKMNVDIPLMFNPVMDTPPRTGSGTLFSDFPGDQILSIRAYPDGSPSWNRASDANVGDGVMDYIQDIYDVASNWTTQVYDASAGTPMKFTNYAAWITNNKPTSIGGSYPAARENEMLSLLDYYIRTTSEASKTNWSHRTMGAIEGAPGDFKIETQNDLQNAASAADLFHSFLPSGYIHGWKRALLVTGLAEQSGATGKSKWNEDLIGATSPYYSMRNSLFNITGYVDPGDLTKIAKIDTEFADIPAEMYAGGLVDMHQIVNTSGVVYSPGQLELEQKKKNGFQALQYINGVIITGHGMFMKQESAASNALTIISYDDTSIDNLPSTKPTIALGRKYWQELQ